MVQMLRVGLGGCGDGGALALGRSAGGPYVAELPPWASVAGPTSSRGLASHVAGDWLGRKRMAIRNADAFVITRTQYGPGMAKLPENRQRPAARLGIGGPWSHGALEALAYARAIATSSEDASRRVAFLLTDNAVELGIKTYLRLSPSKRGGFHITLEEPRFPELLLKMAALFPEGCPVLDPDKLDHFHRLRNALYHHGNGFSPDRVQVDAYLASAEVLLSGLFGSDALCAVLRPSAPLPELELEAVPTLPEALRAAATRVEQRAKRLAEGAPVGLVVPSDIWESAEYAVELVTEQYFEYAATHDQMDWANSTIEHVALFNPVVDPEGATVEDVVTLLRDLVELIEALQN